MSTAPFSTTSAERAEDEVVPFNNMKGVDGTVSAEVHHQLVKERELLSLLLEVATAAHEAEQVEEAFEKALAEICRLTGWLVGHVYMVDGDGRLAPATLWHLSDATRFSAFRQVTEHTFFQAGEGLPGRVLATAAAVWIEDVLADANFPRARGRADLQIRAGMAFPVKAGHEVAAVLEFYADEVLPPDEQMMAVMEHIGSQLGRAVERNRAAEALRRSQSRLARAQALAHVGSWEWEVARGELTWSDEMCRIYGFTPGEQITYEKYVSQLHPADRARVEGVVSAALQNHEPYRFHHRILRANDGAERILLGEGEVVVEGGQVVRMFGTAQDVTEQTIAEQELRERERLLRRAQQIAHFGSWEWNSSTGELKWSDELCRIYGRPSSEAVSFEQYLSFVHPADRPHVAEQIEHARKTLEPFSFQERIFRPDGSVRLLRSAGEVWRDAEGTLWVIGVCHDVTEALEVEEELREGERRFRLLAENMTDFVSLHEPTGHFVYASPSAERILGFKPEELIGRDPYELIHPDDAKRIREETHEQLLSGQAFAEVTYRMATKQGGYVWMDSTSRAITNADGEVEKILSSSRNVTERVRAEQAGARYRNALEARNRELQDFAYVASHDLQEPLRKIRAFSDLILEDHQTQLDEEAQQYLRRVQDAATRMSHLIAELLAFSRVTTKARGFEKVNLDEIVVGVLSDLEVTITESGGRVEVASLGVIDADPLQMRQLFQNLIANALKFHAPDTPPVVKVASKVERRNDAVPSGRHEVCRITVEDNGIGFEEKYLDRIFTPFQRLHNRQHYHGTGMGLAICRRIAERHGGLITAKSQPNQGSTFVVVLPVRQEHDTSNEIA